MFVRSLFVGMGVALFLAACGGTTGVKDTGLKLSGLGYVVTETPETLKLTDTVSGSGKIRFVSQMPGGQSNKVNFNFSLEDGGTLELVMNSRSDLNGGIIIRLGRTGNRLAEALVASRGKTTDFLPKVMTLPEFDTSKPMSLEVHVHNDESPFAHVIITQAGKAPRDAYYNTNRDGHQGDVKDAFFGFALDKATVSSVKIEADKD